MSAGFSHLHRVGGTRRGPITGQGHRRIAAAWLGRSRLDCDVTALLAEPSNAYLSRLFEAFVGARIVHGPGKFSLPVEPVRAVNDVLYGGMPDPRWYAYC